MPYLCVLLSKAALCGWKLQTLLSMNMSEHLGLLSIGLDKDKAELAADDWLLKRLRCLIRNTLECDLDKLGKSLEHACHAGPDSSYPTLYVSPMAGGARTAARDRRPRTCLCMS